MQKASKSSSSASSGVPFVPALRQRHNDQMVRGGLHIYANGEVALSLMLQQRNNVPLERVLTERGRTRDELRKGV